MSSPASSPTAAPDGETALTGWLRLMRVSRTLVAAADQAVRPAGLTGSQFELLAAVGSAEGISQRDLAATLAVTKGNVAQIVARLEAARLLRRVPDGRLNRVYLTRPGRDRLARALPAHLAALHAATSALDAAGRRELDARLETLDRALRADADDAPPP